MKEHVLHILDQALHPGRPPPSPRTFPQGDMPGDKGVDRAPVHREGPGGLPGGAAPICRKPWLRTPAGKAVVAVTGGSGVMKTCVSALLTYYLNQLGVGAFTLSGDNYPRRYPELNDAERVRDFPAGGHPGAWWRPGSTPRSGAALLKDLQLADLDSDPQQCEEHPWLAPYQQAGREALTQYLGTANEQEYDKIEQVLGQFKAGQEKIWLKRLGRDDTALWFEREGLLPDQRGGAGVDPRQLRPVPGGWTSPCCWPVTPARDPGCTGSPGAGMPTPTPAFITMVIQLEQGKIEPGPLCQVIVSKSCEVLTLEEYQRRMAEGR